MLPQKGEILYDKDNKPICHICGQSFHRLMTHVRQKHKMSAYEYKKHYGLDTTKGIASKQSSELARQRVYENYENVIVPNLLNSGKSTQFKPRHKGRTKDKVSLQTKQRLISQIHPPKEEAQ